MPHQSDCFLNIPVKGGALWPSSEMVVDFGGHKLVLKPATNNTGQSIHISIRAISIDDAHTLIRRFLSVLAWCDDQGIESLPGWAGNPAPCAVRLETRFIASSIAFPFGRILETDPKALLALALYREGRTINSIPFSFLSYFKILNIFWGGRGKERKEILQGIRTTIPLLKDSSAVSRLQELANQPDVPAYLYDSCRCAIAHAHSDDIVDPDNVADLKRLSSDINIIKALAEYLMETELRLSRSIIK